MNRFLQCFNLTGVLLLVVLCIFQWQSNRRANLEGIALEKAREELAAKVAEQAKAIQGLNADLERFRDQLTKASAGWKEAEANLVSAQRDNRDLVAERDQLKSSVAAWAQAVAARDDKLKEANQTLQQISVDRNETVMKFNALAEKHNAVVKTLNEALAHRNQ